MDLRTRTLLSYLAFLFSFHAFFAVDCFSLRSLFLLFVSCRLLQERSLEQAGLSYLGFCFGKQTVRCPPFALFSFCVWPTFCVRVLLCDTFVCTRVRCLFTCICVLTCFVTLCARVHCLPYLPLAALLPFACACILLVCTRVCCLFTCICALYLRFALAYFVNLCARVHCLPYLPLLHYSHFAACVLCLFDFVLQILQVHFDKHVPILDTLA